MSDNKILKIAFLVEKFYDVPVGGGAAISLNLLSYLKEKGYTVDVFCEKNNATATPQKVYSEFSENYEHYVRFIENGNYDCIIAGRNALKYPDLHCDIYFIHAHSKYKYHNVNSGKLFNIVKLIKKQIKKENTALNRNKNSLFIFCSEKLRADYCSLANLKNTKVVYPYSNYVPPKDFTKIRNKIFTFGISALGFQNKGGYLALMSAFLLKKSGEKFNLKIIYKKEPGLLQSLLINLLRLNNETEFLLPQRYMHDFYSSLDCLLVPSHLEAFGMVAVEGLSYKLPIIISDTCGVVEVLKDYKNVHVFKFDKFKVMNLYREMKKVISDVSVCENISLMTKDNYNKKIEELILETVKKIK